MCRSQTRICLPRRDAPESCMNQSPGKTEGAGKAGCPMHPQPRVRKKQSTRASSPRSHRIHPAFPTQWFYGLISYSPRRSGFIVTVIQRIWLCPRPVGPTSPPLDLTPASRPQDHTTSPSAHASFVSAPLIAHRPYRPALPSHRAPNAAASTASHPASVTIAIRPCRGRDSAVMDLIWVKREGKYFWKWGWTGRIRWSRFNRSHRLSIAALHGAAAATARRSKAIERCRSLGIRRARTETPIKRAQISLPATQMLPPEATTDQPRNASFRHAAGRYSWVGTAVEPL
jgi:hypothetical protein